MDVSLILEKLESLGFLRTAKITGNYQQIYCPFHNDGNEKKPSCGVLLHDEYRGGQHYPEGWFHCFSCGASYTIQQAITEMLKIHNISKSGKDWLVENIPGFNPDIEFDSLLPESTIIGLNDKYAANYVKSLVKSTTSYVTEDELSKYRFTVPYMYERKLTDEIIQKYDIGVDIHWLPPGRKKEVPCITFPVRDRFGNTLFIARRSIKGKLFHYPEGVVKPLYGLDMIPAGCKSVIIAESCFNALTAVSYGYNAVALLGTGNSYQINQLKQLGVSEYVICTDGDEAGRRAAKKLKAQLSSVAVVWVVPMLEGKDLNDLSKSEFDDLYARRE